MRELDEEENSEMANDNGDISVHTAEHNTAQSTGPLLSLSMLSGVSNYHLSDNEGYWHV